MRDAARPGLFWPAVGQSAPTAAVLMLMRYTSTSSLSWSSSVKSLYRPRYTSLSTSDAPGAPRVCGLPPLRCCEEAREEPGTARLKAAAGRRAVAVEVLSNKPSWRPTRAYSCIVFESGEIKRAGRCHSRGNAKSRSIGSTTHGKNCNVGISTPSTPLRPVGNPAGLREAQEPLLPCCLAVKLRKARNIRSQHSA